MMHAVFGLLTKLSVRCEEPPLLTEGSQQVTTDGITSIVTLLCDIGYSLKGSGTLFCSDNGTWNTVTTPECGMT